jgi:3-oxoacyl-[acyl-carrier protein] reductase
MDLQGRTAFVTGASGAIGGAIARALAAAGADIAVGYVGNRDGAAATCAAVQALGRRAAPIALDQADVAAIDPAIAAVVAAFGRLDILVNNAAWNIGIPYPQLDELTPAIWDRIFDTNARGPFLLARAAAPQLKASGAGRIVNIASIAGLIPSGSSIAYAASKAALIHLTHCLAVAMAPEVNVNCVAPGLVAETRMANRLPPEVIANALERAALRRGADAEDVARQVVVFCQSETVTGQTVAVDAGIVPH